MTKNLFAVWTLLVSIAVGVVGMALLYDTERLGMSYPLMNALIVASVVGSAWRAGQPPNRRNLWLFAPALLLSIMVALRASEWLLFWNVAASLLLTGLALHYIGAQRSFDLAGGVEHILALVESGFRVFISDPILNTFMSLRWFQNRESGDSRQIVAVVRGLVITLPVLGVFALLLGSADAVFESYLTRIEQLFAFENFDAFVERVILAAVIAWITSGAIAYAVLRNWQDDTITEAAVDLAASDDEPAKPDAPADEAAEPPKRASAIPFRLGMVETGMLLGGVASLFTIFVGVQFVYLFGGRANIGVGELTFSEYARRGFFELVAVSVLTMGLILFADRLTVREGKREMWLFRALSLFIVALVGVMLLSAARRMSLYTDALGLTQLRLWTSVFMGWLVVLFGVLIAALFRVRRNIFSFGTVIAAIGFFATMNLLNPDALIARVNTARALTGDADEFDVCYLSYLSADAVPVLVEQFQQAQGEQREQLGALLYHRFLNRSAVFDASEADSVFEYNRGRTRADAALDAVRDDLVIFADAETPCYYVDSYRTF